MASSAAWTSSTKHEPRRGAVAGRAEHRGDALEQPRLRAPGRRAAAAAAASGRSSASSGSSSEASARRCGATRVGQSRRCATRGLAQQLDDRPVGEPRLVLVAARGQHHGAAGAGVRHELVARAASCRSPPRPRSPPAAVARRPRRGPPTQRAELARRARPAAARRAARRRRRAVRAAAGRRGASVPSFTCSYSAAVSSSGADAQLLAERPHAVAVLRERRGAVAAPARTGGSARGGRARAADRAPASAGRGGSRAS